MIRDTIATAAVAALLYYSPWIIKAASVWAGL